MSTFPHVALSRRDGHVVGVTYGAAHIGDRNYLTYVHAEKPPPKYHADMHLDAPDPSDPTSPSNWGRTTTE